MQHLSRHCSRLSSLCRGSASQLVVRQVLETAAVSSNGHRTDIQLPSTTNWLVSHNLQHIGASCATEAGVQEEAAQQQLSRQEFAKLSLQQKKAILKPEKGRNQFKRMWKKDMQIRNAHKNRKEQQARANEERHKKSLAKWSEGAALWHGQSSEPSL